MDQAQLPASQPWRKAFGSNGYDRAGISGKNRPH
jgi:hypothetical protein